MKALDRRNVPRNALVYDPAANEPVPEGLTTFLALFRWASFVNGQCRVS